MVIAAIGVSSNAGSPTGTFEFLKKCLLLAFNCEMITEKCICRTTVRRIENWLQEIWWLLKKLRPAGKKTDYFIFVKTKIVENSFSGKIPAVLALIKP